MKEELLHFVWKFKLLADQNLRSLNDEPVSIIETGIANNSDGPDFLNARVKIGDEEWVGNVEIHINSSDWKKHNHSDNPKYKNIILHVVYFEDTEIEELTFQKIPTLELKGNLPDRLLSNYEELMTNHKWVPCQEEIGKVDEFILNSWLDRLLIERIERKTEFVQEIFEKTGFDWNQTFFEVLSRGFGFKNNAEAFNTLANRIGFLAFQKEKNQTTDNIEALFLGTAGFLPSSSNHYHIQKLIKLFEFQKSKYSIEIMDSKLWVTGGVRPPNQPFVRIIQLINFLTSLDKPLIELMGSKVIIESSKKLKLNPIGYWNSHYRIEQPKVNGVNPMGEKSIEGILINSILPFQFFYAQWIKDETLMSESLELYETLLPEENSIIKKWKSIGIKVKSAGESQALLELKNNYCLEKKCLFCSIGRQILKT